MKSLPWSPRLGRGSWHACSVPTLLPPLRAQEATAQGSSTRPRAQTSLPQHWCSSESRVLTRVSRQWDSGSLWGLEPGRGGGWG